MTRRTSLALAAAVVTLAAVGLTAALWPRPDSSAPSARPAPGPARYYAQVPADAHPMPFEKKGAALPADYPLQVPIIDGTVVRAGTPAPSMWMYELEVASAPDGVGAWYRRAYEGAAWTVVSESREQVNDGLRVMLRLEKGAAVSEIVIESRPGGSLVRATIGVGARGGST